jgi:PKD repeat protein
MSRNLFAVLLAVFVFSLPVILLSSCKGKTFGSPDLHRPVAIAGIEPGPYYADNPVHFFDNGSYDPDRGSISSYQWDWNNDKVWDEEGKDVTHTWDAPGEYYVLFRVTDDDGETDTIDKPIEIIVGLSLPPVAQATADPTEQMNGEPVHLSASGSYDPDGGSISTYEWDFENDGIFDAQGVEVTHAWDIVGTYSVQLKITDDEGETDTLDQPLEITIYGGNPANAVDVTPPWLNFSPRGVCIDGNYAYVAADVNGLHIFDITDPVNPVWVNSIDTPGWAYDVAVSNGYAYVADYDSGLQIIDIDPIESAHIVNFLVPLGSVVSVAVANGYAYIAGGCDFKIVDVNPPESASIIKSLDMLSASDVVVLNGYAYVTDGERGLHIIDVKQPDSAYIVQSVVTRNAAGVVVANGYAYVADYELACI